MPNYTLPITAGEEIILWPLESHRFDSGVQIAVAANEMGHVTVNPGVVPDVVAQTTTQHYAPGYNGKLEITITNTSKSDIVKIKVGDLLGHFMTVPVKPM